MTIFIPNLVIPTERSDEESYGKVVSTLWLLVEGIATWQNVSFLGETMNNKTFNVPNMNCGHCTNTIEVELGDLAGVTSVTTNLDNKEVTVTWDEPTNWEQISVLLQEINYPPA